MAARKRSGTRRKTTRARTRKSTTARKNPSLSLTKRRTSRRRPVAARSRRRGVSRRRSNPSGKVVSLIAGAGLSQIIAAALPFNIGGVLGQAAKVALVGWGLEKFGGRAVPMLFGEAKEGGFIAAGVLLFNAYVAPTVAGIVGGVMPSGNGNAKGVKGLAVTPYPLSPGMPPMMNPVSAAPSGVRGMATAQRFR